MALGIRFAFISLFIILCNLVSLQVRINQFSLFDLHFPVSCLYKMFFVQLNLYTNIPGIGLGELFNKVQEKLGTDSKQSILWTISATLVTTLLVLWQIQRNYARLDQSNNNSYKNYADHLLQNAPINSIVIVEGTII